MRKELASIALLLLVASVAAQQINISQVSSSVDFFGAKTGVTDNSSSNLVFFGFFGGGFIAILILIAFGGIVFYRFKYQSKEGGAVREQDLFGKYNQ